MFLPPLFTLPLSCLIDFMPVHERDLGFHLLCLYSQCNTKFSSALTLLTEIIPKFSSPLLLQEMLKSHFQLNLTCSTSGGRKNPPFGLITNIQHCKSVKTTLICCFKALNCHKKQLTCTCSSVQ